MMSRDSLDPDVIREQIKSALIFPKKSFQERTRRYSVPEHESSNTLDNIIELDTIYENEANTTSGSIDQIDINRSQTSNKTHDDSSSSSKRPRIPPVVSPHEITKEKGKNPTIINSVGTLSFTTNNISGPGGGGGDSSATAVLNNKTKDNSEQTNVVATVAQHANAAMPIASLGLPTGKSHLTNTSSASSAKSSLTGRIRSYSKHDSQSVSDKSLFSKIFNKKSKKPLGTLITTTTKSINLSLGKKRENVNDKSLKTIQNRKLTIDEEDENIDSGERNISTGSLSDTEEFDEKDDELNTSSSSNTTRSNSRANSGTNKKTTAGSNLMTLPTSDSQYYASMSSAPTGFSISYHKHTTKGGDDLRIKAAIGRIQQQNKKATSSNSGGAHQLMALFQDPQRNDAQSSTSRIRTYSGQTIISRSNSSSDRPTTYCIRSTSMSPTLDTDETFVSDDEIYSHFMKCHTCYDIIPKSSKLVIFDTQLSVKKAFFALVYNGVRAAPLWDMKRQKFVGLLTITDFILILQKYYREPHKIIDELEEHKIETWREVLKEYEKPLLYIKPNESLYDAIRILIEKHVHRLPIIDPISNNVIFILTHKRILRFFYLYIYDWPQPSFMSKSLEELKIGTYDNLLTIHETTTVIEALHYFVKYRVSALPVLDKNNKLVNIYSKFDVIGLAPDKSYRNLNMTINYALSYRKERFEAVLKCYKHESLNTCMERIIKAEVHRLVVVDNNDHVIGILSLSDLLKFIVIRPTKSENSTAVVTPTNVESNQEVE